MPIRTCSSCKYHEIRQEAEVAKSYCKKEYCWSEYSKCIARIALEQFFTQQRIVPSSETLPSERQ